MSQPTRHHAPAQHRSAPILKSTVVKSDAYGACEARPKHHGLTLDRQETEQRPNGQSVGYEHERARPAPSGYDLFQFKKAYGGTRVSVRNESPRLLNTADSHQAGCFQAATPAGCSPSYSWFTEGFDSRDLREAKMLLDELS